MARGSRGVLTSGRISSGGTVEREVSFNLAEAASLRPSLRNPDFTAQRVAQAINRFIGEPAAAASDSATSSSRSSPIFPPGS